MQTPEPAPPIRRERRRRPPRPARTTPVAGAWGVRLTWISGLVLMLSAFMDWYVATLPNGLTYAITGWHAGSLGKLVFFVGLATLILVALREAGIALPPSVPEPLVVIGLGALATIFTLIRLISVPDVFFPATARGIGLYLAVLAALGLLASGLLRATDELP